MLGLKLNHVSKRGHSIYLRLTSLSLGQAYMIGTVALKLSWTIWISHMNPLRDDDIITTRKSKTKPCTYFMGYTAVEIQNLAMLHTQYLAKMSSFSLNCHHWLHWKLSFWQLSVQSTMTISSKWRHFRFSAGTRHQSAWYRVCME